MPVNTSSVSAKTNAHTSYLPSVKKVAIVAALVIITGLAVYMAAYRPDLAYKMLSWKVAGGVALAGVVTLLVVTIVNERKNAPLRRISEGKASTQEVLKFFSSLSHADVEKVFATKDGDGWRKTGMPYISAFRARPLVRQFGNDRKWLEAMVKGVGTDYERMLGIFAGLNEEQQNEMTAILKEQNWHKALVKEFGMDQEIFKVLGTLLLHHDVQEIVQGIISQLRAENHLIPLLAAKSHLVRSNLFEYFSQGEIDVLFAEELKKESLLLFGVLHFCPSSLIMDNYLERWAGRHENNHRTLEGIKDSFDELFAHIASISKGEKQITALAFLVERLDTYLPKLTARHWSDETVSLIDTIFEKMEKHFELSKLVESTKKGEIRFQSYCATPLKFLFLLRIKDTLKDFQSNRAHIIETFLNSSEENRAIALHYCTKEDDSTLLLDWLRGELRPEILHRSRSLLLFSIFDSFTPEQQTRHFPGISAQKASDGEVTWKVDGKGKDKEEAHQ